MVKFKYDQTNIHLSYDKSRRLPQETITLWLETLSKYLPRDSIKTIIDLGCGTGRFTKSLSDHFSAKVYGIDLSWKMLTVAKQALMSPMIGFVQGSAESLPLADGSADMIFLSMVYHHIQDKSQAILEFKRVLKAGGFLSIRTTTIDNLDSCFHLQFFPTARQISLSRLPAIGSLTDFLQGYGFVLKGHIREKNVIALVDPLPLSADEVREVEELGMPTHILLTCNFHLRESERYRQKWGCKIYINRIGLEDAEVPIDGTFQDGDRLWDFIDMIHTPDVYFPEETTFLVEEEEGILIIGDALSGGRKDQGIPDGELGIPFPEHIIDIQKARVSLFRLLDYSFEVICFGHGSPILNGAKEKLGQFLNNDEIWEQLNERHKYKT